MNGLDDYLLEKARPKTRADAEFEAMRCIHSHLARLDQGARQRVVSHVMGMLKDKPHEIDAP